MAADELKAAERYRYLIQAAAQSGTLWASTGPSENQWASFTDPRGHLVLPLWPARDDGAKMATGVWRRAVPTAIPLKALVDMEIAGL